MSNEQKHQLAQETLVASGKAEKYEIGGSMILNNNWVSVSLKWGRGSFLVNIETKQIKEQEA